jgi:hypothetical protein
LIRGGNYNNTANGFASFNANNPRSNRNGNIGFRAALPAVIYSVMMLWVHGPTSRAVQVKGSESSVRSKSEIFLEEKSRMPAAA